MIVVAVILALSGAFFIGRFLSEWGVEMPNRASYLWYGVLLLIAAYGCVAASGVANG